MRRIVTIILFAVVMLVSSCERRELMDLSNTHYVRVYIDEEIKNVTTGFYDENNARPAYKSPSVVRVILADAKTGAAKADRYLRNRSQDAKGTYYDGYIIAEPGDYKLMAYNFDTEVTLTSATHIHHDAKAYTNKIASLLYSKLPSRVQSSVEEEIVYDPDHLFAASCEYVHIPYLDVLDTLKTEDGEHFMARSIVKSYFLQVRVKGIQHVSSTVALLTGMAGSAWLCTGEMDVQHPVTVYFEMLQAESGAAGISRSSADEAVIYTTFSTFGRIPDSTNKLEITFDFLTVYGKPYSATFDLSEKFLSREAQENQWLLLDEEVIEIPEPPKADGGGFRPSVGQWGDVETEIIL